MDTLKNWLAKLQNSIKIKFARLVVFLQPNFSPKLHFLKVLCVTPILDNSFSYSPIVCLHNVVVSFSCPLPGSELDDGVGFFKVLKLPETIWKNFDDKNLFDFVCSKWSSCCFTHFPSWKNLYFTWKQNQTILTFIIKDWR